jgi:NAD(P)-dependent dehydrogenase (short-subunit alcohol dehydrogenase family)
MMAVRIPDSTGSQPVAPSPQERCKVSAIGHASHLPLRPVEWVVLALIGTSGASTIQAARHKLDGMTTTLITGGNKGLGYEAARRLHELGHTVVIGSRNSERGAAAAEALGIEWITLDVTSDDSVAATAIEFRDRFGSLDVLVNNAGIPGRNGPLDQIDGPAVAEVLNTNTLSIVRVTHAFLPLLRESSNPVIVNVSSGLGSFAVRADPSRIEHSIPSLGYSASKAAVNMLTSVYAQFLPELRINAVDPGYTATDLNGHSGPQTVEEGTDAIVRMASIGVDGPTGTFSDRDGPVEW